MTYTWRALSHRAHWAHWALWGLLVSVLAQAAQRAEAQPKVCGNQAALGNFELAKCPSLRDDGMPPDAVAGDGLFSAEVRLAATPLLRYKILPSGAYGPDELKQVGACGPGGDGESPTGDVLVPTPDTTQPARFYYDGRPPADSTWATPPSNRSGGETLMAGAPADRPPSWIAVGDFQGTPFDPPGGLDLRKDASGVFAGSLTLSKSVPAGWQWKVFEKGRAYTEVGARKFGVNGWSYTTRCDSDNVRVTTPLGPGDEIQLSFDPQIGRLRTVVLRKAGDGAEPEDLGSMTSDLRLLQDGAASDDRKDSESDLAPDGGDRELPGIHCKCQFGRRGGKVPGGVGILLLVLGLFFLGRRGDGHFRNH